MPEVTLTATVDWEGYEIRDENIDAIKKFRNDFPDVPFTHFICPSYFTRDFNNKKIAEQIRSVMTNNDEVALHVHCWYSLLEKAGVPYRSKPTWNPGGHPGLFVSYDKGNKIDLGHAVPLGSYGVEEIRKIIMTSLEILSLHHLIETPDNCTGFRCGGWVSSDSVFEALLGAGNFLYDASAAPANFFKKLYERLNFPICRWLSMIWGNSRISEPSYLTNTYTFPHYNNGVTGLDHGDSHISQPTYIASLNIMEAPDTGALADYVTFRQLTHYIDKAAETGADTTISIGFHQETATWPSPEIRPEGSTNIEVFANAVKYFLNLPNIESRCSTWTKRLTKKPLHDY